MDSRSQNSSKSSSGPGAHSRAQNPSAFTPVSVPVPRGVQKPSAVKLEASKDDDDFRKERNRKFAKESRQRKKEHVALLEQKVKALESEVANLKMQLN